MNLLCVALDLETTGLDPRRDAIIEVAAVKFRGQRTLDTFHSLVNPQRPLPQRIQRLTGIDPQEVEQAPSLGLVLPRLAHFLGDAPWVGHNVKFDAEFLAARNLAAPPELFDTFDLASVLLPRQPDYSLGALAHHLKVSPKAAHRALPDALATRDVFLRLLEHLEALDPFILAEMARYTSHDRQGSRPTWSLVSLIQRVEQERARQATPTLGTVLAAQADRKDVYLTFLATESTPNPPLAGRPDKSPVDAEEVAAAFAPGGALEQVLPHFESRLGQVQMARAVAQALNADYHLTIEAGTGTGKSLAYLLPAALFAWENQTPVVISTHTINLQEQLVTKDLPQARQVLKVMAALPGKARLGQAEAELRVAQLKGRANYLCLRQWAVLRQSPSFSLAELRLLLRLLVWLPSTKSGDRAELNLTPDEVAAWARLGAPAEGCLGESCAYREQGLCFLYRARQQALGAHLIVVNHALLLADLKGSQRLLPDYDYLVIDEAHRLEEAATEQLGFRLSQFDLLNYLNQVGGPSGVVSRLGEPSRPGRLATRAQRPWQEVASGLKLLTERARRHTEELLRAIATFAAAQGPSDYDLQLRLGPSLTREGNEAWSQVANAWEAANTSLAEVETNLHRLDFALEGLSSAQIDPDLRASLVSLASQGYQQRQQVQEVLVSPEPDQVYWIEVRRQNQGIRLCAAPIHVGPRLAQALFAQKNAAILTSATLSTEGSFAHLKERLGIVQAQELSVAAPFDYLRSTLVYLPKAMPEPGSPGYQRAVEEVLLALSQATQGRTMALFTSHSALRATATALRRPLEEAGIALLAHGVDGSPKQLLAAFRDHPKAVLLGTASFWEGIDVVGDALSVLVITRLPFSVPTDPVFAARSEALEDGFHQYALPQSILRFRQGFGRLIRSRHDRGVLVILDRRVESKPYGAAFLDSLPLCTVRRGSWQQLPEEAVAWLGTKADSSVP